MEGVYHHVQGISAGKLREVEGLGHSFGTGLGSETPVTTRICTLCHESGVMQPPLAGVHTGLRLAEQ